MMGCPKTEESNQMNLHLSEVVLANQSVHLHKRNPG